MLLVVGAGEAESCERLEMCGETVSTDKMLSAVLDAADISVSASGLQSQAGYVYFAPGIRRSVRGASAQ